MAELEEQNIKIVGKLGDRVYYYRDGELVDRAYFIPVQPGTDGQRAWWNQFRRGVRSWQALSPAEKDPYNQRAKRFRFSGFNLYMREWLNALA